MITCSSCVKPMRTEAARCPACGGVSEHNEPIYLPVGALLENRWRVGAVVAHGGFGAVYRGRDEQTDELIAIKEFFPLDFTTRGPDTRTLCAISGREGDYRFALEKFATEAKTLALLEHPHIVPVRRHFEANNTAYAVMKFIEGRTLEATISDAGPVSLSTLLRWMQPILDAVAYLHDRGLIHRDIKPSNILIAHDGTPTLIDFGTVKWQVARSMSLHNILTHGYAPIEQYSTTLEQKKSIDTYALAATFYFALVGKVPPDAPSRTGPNIVPLVWPKAGSAFPPAVRDVLERALCVEASRRPQDAAVFRHELLAAYWAATRASGPSPSETDPILLTVGRDDGNDIILEPKTVSGVHAQITLLPDGIVAIEDLGSNNGTYVNGVDIAEHFPGIKKVITPADRITISTYPLTFEQIRDAARRRLGMRPSPRRSPPTVLAHPAPVRRRDPQRPARPPPPPPRSSGPVSAPWSPPVYPAIPGGQPREQPHRVTSDRPWVRPVLAIIAVIAALGLMAMLFWVARQQAAMSHDATSTMAGNARAGLYSTGWGDEA